MLNVIIHNNNTKMGRSVTLCDRSRDFCETDTEIMSTYVQPIEKKSLIHMALWWLFLILHTDYDKNDNLKPENLTYLK